MSSSNILVSLGVSLLVIATLHLVQSSSSGSGGGYVGGGGGGSGNDTATTGYWSLFGERRRRTVDYMGVSMEKMHNLVQELQQQQQQQPQQRTSEDKVEDTFWNVLEDDLMMLYMLRQD